MFLSELVTVAQCGIASYYGKGDGFAGQITASGEIMRPGKMTTAHKKLPMGTRVKVTNRRSKKSVIVKVNDRGPYTPGRILDLSYGAFIRIGSPSSGVIPVCYTII
jgi:rare lipoprotein A